METKAILRGVRLSAQKRAARRRPDPRPAGRQGVERTRVQSKKGAVIIKKVLESAIANAYRAQ